MREGFEGLTVDGFGGLCTRVKKSDLAPGLSPANLNVEYFPGGVGSRRGIGWTVVFGASPITGLFDYVAIDGTHWILAFDNAGTLWKKEPGGAAAAAVATGLGSGLYMEGVAFQGRAYLTFHDGRRGINFARQFDGTNLDPISQAGPVTVPTAAENGAVAGSFTAGNHAYVIVYETRNGYLTACTVRGYVNCAVGGKAIDFTGVPRGPSNVIRRRIYMSLALVVGDPGLELFTSPKLWIEDNTTANPQVTGLSDAELASGDALENAPTRILLPPAACIATYGNRLIVGGLLNELPHLLDFGGEAVTAGQPIGLEGLTFDGSAAAFQGWTTADPNVTVGTVGGTTLLAGCFTADGLAGTIGPLISTQQTTSWRISDSLEKQTAYKIRVRVRKSTAIAPATAAIVFYISDAAGVAGGGQSVSLLVSAIGTQYAWYEGAILNAGDAGGYLSIKVINALQIAAGGGVFVDAIQFFPTTDPYAIGGVWGSVINEPENFDASTSINAVNRADGEGLRGLFELRGNLYALKERSLWVTTDNGLDFRDWEWSRVAEIVGCPGPGAWAMGEGWVVIAARSGLYLFDGGMPQKLTDEIQSLWNAIYWYRAYTIRVAVEPEARRVRVLVPMMMPLPWESGAADLSPQYPTIEMTLDYSDGGFENPMAEGTQATSGRGRKWTVCRYLEDAVRFRTVKPFEWSDGTTRLLLGGDDGAAYYPIDAYHVDVDRALAQHPIDSYYETAPIGRDMGRSLFGMVLMKARGAGSLTTTCEKPGGTTFSLGTRTLSEVSDHDLELQMRKTATQLSVRVRTTATAAWWSVRRMAVLLKKAVFSEFRGLSS